jgi:nucleolar complex protein 2
MIYLLLFYIFLGTLIPIPSLLLDVLRCPEFGKSTPSTRKPPQLEFIVKVSTKELQTKTYQEACVVKALELLENHFTIHKWSISYPELAHSTIAALRRFSRDSQVANWRQRCKAVMTRIQKQSVIVEDKRNGVHFGPKDLILAKSFMSKEASDAQQRFLLEQQNKQDKAELENEKNASKHASKKSKKSKKNKEKEGEEADEEEEQEEDAVMGGMEDELYEDEKGEDRVEDLVLSDSD